MPMDTWLTRLRALDVRLLAAVAAALMLIIGVMWVVPTTPTSNSFTFDLARRGLSDARPVELDEAVQGNLVDGSDADFYRIDPSHGAHWLDIHMMNGSATLIPGIWIIDSAKKVIQDQTAEYVRRPGANIDVSLLAQPDMTYYVTVFGQRNTTGPYTLTVSQRTSGQ